MDTLFLLDMVMSWFQPITMLLTTTLEESRVTFVALLPHNECDYKNDTLHRLHIN